VLHLDDPALADVDADDGLRAALAELLEATCRGIRSRVVEAHPVDHRAIRYKTEQTGLGVAVLADGGDRADLDVSESEGGKPTDSDRVLVETGRDAERRVEDEPERLHPLIRRR
jgi:hypothetical protein